MPRLFGVFAVLLTTIALGGPTLRAQASRSAALKLAIERALAAAPANLQRLRAPEQAGVGVQRVDVQATAAGAERVTIDLTQRALTYEPSGNIEPLLEAIIHATAGSVGATPHISYRFTIDGLPLEQFLPRLAPRSWRSFRSLPAGGAVVVSPGHGLYWDEVLGTWHLQRPRIQGIVEDLVNWDIARSLRDELLAADINTQMVRYAERDEVTGLSGNPRWQEAAKYFIQMLGAPDEVWNYGADDYARDINTRPFYANWIDAAAVVSIHNNGGQETGTETWFDDTNGWQEESRRLAEIVQRDVVSAIRTQYNGNWVDRGLRSCDGCKGETRLASRPAVIVEIAYMDTLSPDNDALHDDAFKHIVAAALRGAIQEWRDN
jgi:N-acetylmuramoyl-L-alanine amidase